MSRPGIHYLVVDIRTSHEPAIGSDRRTVQALGRSCLRKGERAVCSLCKALLVSRLGVSRFIAPAAQEVGL